MDTPCIPRRYLFASKTKSVEWVMTGFMLVWGLSLTISHTTFSISAYREFVRLGLTEEDLSIFYLSFAGIRASVLYLNGSFQRGPEIRFVCAAVGAFTWIITALLFALPWLQKIAPLPVNAGQHLVMFGGELYAIGVATFDRRRRG